MEEKMWKIDDNKWIGAINLKTNSKYDENGIDKHGFNEEGIHVVTGTQFDENGYNRFGFNADGVNKYSININGKFVNSTIRSNLTVKYIKTIYGRLENRMDILASDNSIYLLYSEKFPILKKRQEERIFDANGIDQQGFNRKGIHVSGFPTDNDGYNALGYDLEGYDRDGYDLYGFDKNGYDEYGYDLEGRDNEGYDREGYDKKGYNKQGLDRNGKKRTEEKPSEEEILRKAITEEQRRKNFLFLKDNARRLANGEMSLEEYMKISKTSIEDLIQFAKKQKMGADVIRELNKYTRLYKEYKKPFSKKDYLESTILIINGEEVRPAEEDVDKCIEYLRMNDSWICDKTVRATIRGFLRGEIDITAKGEAMQQREVSVSEIKEVAEGQRIESKNGAMNAITIPEEGKIQEGQSHNDE